MGRQKEKGGICGGGRKKVVNFDPGINRKRLMERYGGYGHMGVCGVRVKENSSSLGGRRKLWYLRKGRGKGVTSITDTGRR